MPSTIAWVASWGASPQPVWGRDFLFPTNLPDMLHDQTVRQVVRLSLGGDRLRLVFTNAHGRQPLQLGRVTVALPAVMAAGKNREAGGAGETTAGAPVTVTFGGCTDAVIPPGAAVLSDPVKLVVPDRGRLIVSAWLPQATPLQTFHWDARQTSWIAPGDQTADASLQGDVLCADENIDALAAAPRAALFSTTARPLLAGVHTARDGQVGDARAPGHGHARPRTVVVMGDSITDGATASMDRDARWPDFLAARLAPRGVAVANAGISGARLLSDGMGVNALARLDRDVLAQPGVASLIVLLGINDIAWPGTAFAPDSPRPSLAELQAGFRQLAEQTGARGIRIIGATLPPFEGALPDTPLDNYYHPDKDVLRRQLNDWIRHSGTFDAVTDFDAVLRDPQHPARMASPFDSGDHLHPGDVGNRAMAGAIDLDALFAGDSPGAP